MPLIYRHLRALLFIGMSLYSIVIFPNPCDDGYNEWWKSQNSLGYRDAQGYSIFTGLDRSGIPRHGVPSRRRVPPGIKTPSGEYVTGYDLGTVLQGLGIQHLRDYRGKTVLTVGEGYSGLLGGLLDEGAMATALDKEYFTPNLPPGPETTKLRSFEIGFSEHLVRADATNFAVATDSPLHGKKYDSILGHLLVNNIDDHADATSVIRNCVMALRDDGGVLKLSGFTKSDLENYFIPQVIPALEKELHSSLWVRYVQTEGVGFSNWLLEIEKSPGNLVK